MIWKIWLLVPVFYGLFALWYFNWRGPITQTEIDTFMSDFENRQGSRHTDVEIFRKFLEQDDGGEFVMLNQVQLHPGNIPHPRTGEMQQPTHVLSDYFRPFAWALFKRGGHPVFQAKTVGGNIDSWNAEDNVSFGTTAMMRYRSRRDLVELVLNPAFADGHLYKLAAIEKTISYPTQVLLSTSLRPPVAVLLILLLLASMAQNIAFYWHRLP